MAKLWKEPDLEEQIKTFEPEPDPMQQQIQAMQLENAQLQNQKVKMEIAKMAKDIESEDSKIDERVSRTSVNLDSESEENIANARYKNAQAAKLEEEKDVIAQEFLRTQDGTKRAEMKEDKEFDHLSRQIDKQESNIYAGSEQREKELTQSDVAQKEHMRNLEIEDAKAFNQMDLNQQNNQQNINTGA